MKKYVVAPPFNLSRNATSSPHSDGVSPKFIASVYHQLHAIDNFNEFDTFRKKSQQQSIPSVSTAQSSLSKNTCCTTSPITSFRSNLAFCSPLAARVNVGKHTLETRNRNWNDSCTSGHDTALSHLNLPGGTNVSHLESKASSGLGLANGIVNCQLFGNQNFIRSNSCTTSAKGHLACAFQHGGIEAESCDNDIFDDDDQSSDESQCLVSNIRKANLSKDSVGVTVEGYETTNINEGNESVVDSVGSISLNQCIFVIFNFPFLIVSNSITCLVSW